MIVFTLTLYCTYIRRIALREANEKQQQQKDIDKLKQVSGVVDMIIFTIFCFVTRCCVCVGLAIVERRQAHCRCSKQIQAC